MSELQLRSRHEASDERIKTFVVAPELRAISSDLSALEDELFRQHRRGLRDAERRRGDR